MSGYYLTNTFAIVAILASS